MAATNPAGRMTDSVSLTTGVVSGSESDPTVASTAMIDSTVGLGGDGMCKRRPKERPVSAQLPSIAPAQCMACAVHVIPSEVSFVILSGAKDLLYRPFRAQSRNLHVRRHSERSRGICTS